MSVQDPRHTQTALPISPALRARQALELRRRLASHVQGTLDLAVTDNRAVMISVQRDPRHARYTVRLHHIFVDASDEIVAELGRYIVHNDRDASKRLGDYIDAQTDRIRPRRGEPRGQAAVQPLRTTGQTYDLQAIFDELNAEYFERRVQCKISWGRHLCRGRSRRSVKLGSYSVEEALIRIHPGLDQTWIPSYYIRWVVFHEMLHAIHPAPVVNGRHSFHTDSFARDEQRFRDYLPATAWERRNLAALLCI